MKQIIFTVFSILVTGLVCFAQTVNLSQNYFTAVVFDDFAIFDVYENLHLKDEKARLDNLFITIKNDKKLKALIVFRFGKEESGKKKIKRLKEIAKFLDYRKVDKTKFTLAVLDNESERTEIYVEPEDANIEDLLIDKTKNCIIKAEEFKQKINELFPKK